MPTAERFLMLLAVFVLSTAAITTGQPVDLDATRQTQAVSDEFVHDLRIAFMKQRRELRRAHEAEGEPLRAMIDEQLSEIEPEQLSVDQITALMRSYVIQSWSRFDEVVDRLDAVAQQPTTDGARAATALLYLCGDAAYDEQHVEYAKQFFTHPKLGDIAHSEEMWYATRSLSRLSDAKIGRLKEHLPLITKSISEDAEIMAMIHFAPMLELLLQTENNAASDASEQMRVAMLDAMTHALESDRPKSANDLRNLKRHIAYFDGAYLRGQLLGSQVPEMNILWSSEPEIESFEDVQGHVVVLDFWATWCGPCVASFPNVQELLDHYAGYPVRVVGVTSLQGRHIGPGRTVIDTADDPQAEFELMEEFIEQREITWPIVFTEQNVFNPDFMVNGIPHVAIIDTKGVVRYRGLHPMAPLSEKTAKIDALLAEAGITPPSPPRSINEVE